MLALSACVTTGVPEGGGPRPTSRWELRLPDTCEHWRPALEADLALLETRYARVADRWPTDGWGPLRIAVAADPAEAGAIADRLDLPGNSRVPRTHPGARVALIPLPRNDSLVTGRRAPPVTWRETFRHEAAHLLSIDRPGLREAPLWFQEGFAEAWTDLGSAAAPSPWSSAGAGAAELAAWFAREPDLRGTVLYHLDGVASEARLAAWREMVKLSLERGVPVNEQPWLLVEDLPLTELRRVFAAHGIAPLPLFRGREVSPPENGEGLLLASFPGEIVGALVAAEWDGRPTLDFRVSIGRTGFPEAGMTVSGRGDRRLRVRFGRHNELAAYLERKDEVVTRPHTLRAEPAPRRDAARRIELGVRGGELVLGSGGTAERFPLIPRSFEPPFAIEFYVRDGALVVAGEGAWPVAARP